MKKLNVNLGILLVVVTSLSMSACKNGGNENADDATAEEDHATMDHSTDDPAHQMMEMEETAAKWQDNQAGQVIAQYLAVKNALVNDDVDASATAGEQLFSVLEEFSVEEYEAGQQQELVEILEDSKEHAEHISMSDIAHQREHFLTLSENMMDMVAITGTPQGLYQQYCPMYNDNKGGTWLSASEEVRNPYYGASMLTCGKVQQEIKG